MLRRVFVGDNERVLLIRKGRFAEILGPGEYWIVTLGRNVEVLRYNVQALEFTSEWAGFLVNQRPDLVAQYFTVIETGASQVAVVYLDGRIARVILPLARVMFWRGAVNVTFEVIDAAENPQVPERLMQGLLRLPTPTYATIAIIEEGKRGLVYLYGKLARELGPGTYGFWTAVGSPKVEWIETRRQTVEVPGQEILTKDKVTVRVNVSAVYEIVDVATSRGAVKDVNEYLYRTLQIAVRQTLGKRTLEEVEKTDLDETVAAGVRREMEACGVRVGAIALKDVVLPGDIREILNQVVRRRSRRRRT